MTDVNAAAELTSVTATSNSISDLLKPNAGLTSDASSAYVASAQSKPSVGLAALTATANSALAQVKASAGVATATASANSAIDQVKPTAGVATATATSNQPVITINFLPPLMTGTAQFLTPSHSHDSVITVNTTTVMADMLEQYLPGLVIQPIIARATAQMNTPEFVAKLWGIVCIALGMTPTKSGTSSVTIRQNSVLSVAGQVASQGSVTISSISTLKIKPLKKIESLFVEV